jgi:hypothetical protein
LYQENSLRATVTFLLKFGADRLNEYEGEESPAMKRERLVGLYGLPSMMTFAYTRKLLAGGCESAAL